MINQYNNTRANEFDRLAGDLELDLALYRSVGDSVLDIGCGIGELSEKLLCRFRKVVGLDLSLENINRAMSDPIYLNNSGRLSYYIGNAESFSLEEKFSTILMSNILEHLDNPVQALKTAGDHLAPGGVIIIIVPNAWSINRILGKEMGLISDEHELSKSEIELYGHKRVYDPYLLEEDIFLAGLKIGDLRTAILKPFTNEQMWNLCKDKPVEWQKKFVNALHSSLLRTNEQDYLPADYGAAIIATAGERDVLTY